MLSTQEPKKNPKATISHERRQRILWTIRGGYRSLSIKTRGFEANRTRKLTRTFGEIFVAKVLWGTFSVPNLYFVHEQLGRFQQNSRDIAQVIGRHNLQLACMQKDQTLKKIRPLL